VRIFGRRFTLPAAVNAVKPPSLFSPARFLVGARVPVAIALPDLLGRFDETGAARDQRMVCTEKRENRGFLEDFLKSARRSADFACVDRPRRPLYIEISVSPPRL
jgi:hypothetical protein